MKKLLILFLVTTTMACSSLKIAVDYDRQIDFSTYKTYNYAEGDLLPNVGQLDRNRIIEAIENEMSQKGFTKSDNPDIRLDMHVKTEEQTQATATTSGSAYGYGYGRYGYGGGFSTTQISYDEYTVGTLIINLVENSSQNIVWQGTGSKTLAENASTDKKESNINYTIQQIFRNYPPGK
jgi:hypothetical protein